ncbi:MAG: hypothetical protein MZV64_11970 [Ignavibacteriales bacterium]|nr:hypothetical protein [Ignavibacteriales bacterium]
MLDITVRLGGPLEGARLSMTALTFPARPRLLDENQTFGLFPGHGADDLLLAARERSPEHVEQGPHFLEADRQIESPGLERTPAAGIRAAAEDVEDQIVGLTVPGEILAGVIDDVVGAQGFDIFQTGSRRRRSLRPRHIWPAGRPSPRCRPKRR